MSEDDDKAKAAAEDAAEIQRRAAAPGVPFKPGPDSRRGRGGSVPKGVARVRKLARSWTEEAIQTLADIMLDKKGSSKVRVDAACALLDRGYGKPRQPLTGAEEGSPVSIQADGAIYDWLKRLEEHARSVPAGETPTMLPPPEIMAEPVEEDD